MERSKAGTKKGSPDGLSLPDQNRILIKIIPFGIYPVAWGLQFSQHLPLSVSSSDSIRRCIRQHQTVHQTASDGASDGASDSIRRGASNSISRRTVWEPLHLRGIEILSVTLGAAMGALFYYCFNITDHLNITRCWTRKYIRS